MAKKELRSASVADKFIETATAETKAEKDEVAEAKEKTSILEEQANKAPKEEAVVKEDYQPQQPPKMGQPKKYDEPTKHISFSLPVSVVENLKIIAALRKTNQTQLILSLINRELEIEAEKIKAYKELLK